MKTLNKIICAIYVASYIVILTLLSISRMVEYATKRKLILGNIEHGLIGIMIYLGILGIIYLVIRKIVGIKKIKHFDIIVIGLTVLFIPTLYYISLHYAYRPRLGYRYCTKKC